MKRAVACQISQSEYQEFNEALASFENIAPPIVGLTAMGEVIYANDSACDLFGCPKEELEGLQIRTITPGMTVEEWSSFWPGLDREDSKPAGRTLHLSGKKKLSVEFRALFNYPPGLKFCLMNKPEESPAAGLGGGIHSSPLVRVLNSMADHVVVLDDQHKTIFLNQALCQSLGLTVAEASGTTVYDYLPRRQAAIAWEHEQHALDSMRPSTRTGDGFLRAKYGESVTMLPFLDPCTSQKRLLVIVTRPLHSTYLTRIVTAKPHEFLPGAVGSGYRSELQEVLETCAPLGIFLKNNDNRFLWVNHVFARMAGLEPEDFTAKRVEDLVSDPEALAAFCKGDDEVCSTGRLLFGLIAPRFDNQPGYYRVDKIPFKSRNGKIAGIIGLVVEIDEPYSPLESLKKELASTSKKLEETETALRVLIERREQDAALSRETLNAKVKGLLVPYLESLKQTQLTAEQAEFVELIETNLKNFYDPAYAKLSSPAYKLSPTELKVSQFVRDGKTNKEIAKLLHLSKSTILTHRHHIRVKLGIKNKKVNLRCLLTS